MLEIEGENVSEDDLNAAVDDALTGKKEARTAAMIEKGAKIAENEKEIVMNKIVESSLPNNHKGDAKTRLTKAIVN